jgi:copper homeostasis protein CutC
MTTKLKVTAYSKSRRRLKREFELCARTLQACEAAELGGARRIELCAALNEGGVSRSRGFLKGALSSVKTPVHVLIRPRWLERLSCTQTAAR